MTLDLNLWKIKFSTLFIAIFDSDFFLKFCKNIKSHVDIKIQLIHITCVEQDFNK